MLFIQLHEQKFHICTWNLYCTIYDIFIFNISYYLGFLKLYSQIIAHVFKLWTQNQLIKHHEVYIYIFKLNVQFIWFISRICFSFNVNILKPIHMIYALRSQCAGLGVVWPPKTDRSAGLFVRSAGLFLLTFFTFCYFLLHFLLLVTSVIYFFTIKGSLFVTFLLLVIFINYFLLLREARGIVELYLFIVQGEEVRLDFF
jgi:hypothetical protein